jgi:prevent-host-death family protein
MNIKILPTSDVRNHMSSILDELQKKHSALFITRNGRAVATLLPIELYDQLMSELEDRLDENDPELAKDIEEARKEHKAGKYRTL